MNIVLDTHGLVSEMINPHGPPGRIVDLLRSSALTLVVDDRILSEYTDVLERPEFREIISRKNLRNIIEYLRYNSKHVLCTTFISDLPDPFDAPFLEVAVELGSYLVTGNLKHFPQEKRHEVTVLSPAEFIAAWK